MYNYKNIFTLTVINNVSLLQCSHTLHNLALEIGYFGASCDVNF